MSEQRSSSLVSAADLGCKYSHTAEKLMTALFSLQHQPNAKTSEKIATLHLNMSLQTRHVIHIFEINQISTGALVLDDEASHGVNRAPSFPSVAIC